VYDVVTSVATFVAAFFIFLFLSWKKH